MLSHLLIDFDGTLVRQDPLLKLRFLWQAIRILDGTCSPYKVLAAAAAIRRALRNADGQSSIDATSAEVFERETGLSGRGYAEMCRIAVLKATRYEALDGALSFLHWAQRYFKLILATNPLFQRGVLV
ncbi:MAG: hypothetical protein KDK78_08940, partial [Chlamydiia bacterium]|nr:hypothetical protein [Chlamydiia bacterium]